MTRSPVGFGVNDQFDYDSCQMVKSNIDGTGEIVIVDHYQNKWSAFGNPHWHPSGSRIIILAQPTDEFFVFSLDTNEDNPKQLTNQFSIDPNWSHDGNKIVFIGLNSTPTPPASFDDFEVFIADYDYSLDTAINPIQLTDDNLRDHDPCFSPDGSEIAFSSGSPLLTYADIVRIDTVGDSRTMLIEDGTTNGGPVNWGSNDKIYYHNVNLFVTPFTAKEYSVTSSLNIDLFPSVSEGYISPFYFDLSSALNFQEFPNQSRLSVYPNPVKDNITIEFESENSFGSLTVTDFSGKVFLQKSISNKNEVISLKSLSPGFYTVQIFTDNEKISKKIIKI